MSDARENTDQVRTVETAETARLDQSGGDTDTLGGWLTGAREGSTELTGRTPSPRIRWAGIVWGLVFVAAGWATIWTLLDPERRSSFSEWVVGLSDGGWIIAAAVALGGLLLVTGLIAGLRAATGDGGRSTRRP
ncbi:hypothetical protein [Gryllotalpicola ginsengisoli]|uniref:hypothetical protein n=1 Tax=Gryllotalpicola ginsengisoli TaxID=444608 RepID=UPI00052556F3|nr:hypothetical protein [Gryllotalpicola ginsengisoli]